eukprot:Em0001g3255a
MAAAHNCEICGKVFSFKSKYERHLETQYHLDNVKRLHYCDSMDNVTSSYIEEPITATYSALSGVSASQPSESDDGHSIDDCCSDDASSTDEDDSATIMSLIQSDPHVNGRYKPFSSKIEAMAYLIAHCPRPMHTTSSGIPFYVNSIVDTVKKCMANHQISKNLVRFPVVPQKDFREMYHGMQWRSNRRFYSPMAVSPAVGHIFLNDFVECVYNDVKHLCCIYKSFYVRNNMMVCLLLEHHPTEPSSYIIANLKLIPVTSITAVMPQANTWARHIYKYSENGTLLVKLTNEAPVMEMAVPLVHELQSLEEGMLMFDALFNNNVIVIAPVICFLCDNPRAAEICNHLGSSTHKFCWICMADVRSDHICVGVKRKKHDSLMQVQRIKAAKTHQAKSTIRTEYGLYKYSLRAKIPQLSQQQRAELSARISAFQTSGHIGKISTDVAKHYKSFVAELEVWIAVSKVFKIAYCDPFDPEKMEYYKTVCQNFVTAIENHLPEWKTKLKHSSSIKCSLDLIKLSIAEVREVTLNSLDPSFTVLLPHGLDRDQQVTSGSAIVGSDGLLINICDFIQHKSQANITNATQAQQERHPKRHNKITLPAHHRDSSVRRATLADMQLT